MQRLIEISNQYQDGLITAHEYLAFVVVAVGKEWQLGQGNGTAFADYISNALIHGLSNTLGAKL